VSAFDGDLRLTDGHTRALAAHLTGAEAVAVEYDEDLPDQYDVALYRECIRWCDEAAVERVPDLVGRVLDPETFERERVEGCRRAGDRPEG
jgi:hypothetical protein